MSESESEKCRQPLQYSNPGSVGTPTVAAALRERAVMFDLVAERFDQRAERLTAKSNRLFNEAGEWDVKSATMLDAALELRTAADWLDGGEPK